MKAEDILAAAQKDKKRGNEYENKILTHGDTLTSLITLCIGMILFAIKYFASGVVDTGLLAVSTCASGVQYFYAGIKFKKWYHILCGVFLLVICFMTIILFIGELVTE